MLDDHGEPIARARVALDSDRYTASGDDGRFGFDDLAPGLYRLSARRDDLCAYLTLVMLYEGREPVDLIASPGITLRVHVTDVDSPVAGARLLIGKELVGVTDGEGLAVVRGVGAQFQVFEVTADGYAPAFLSMWLARDPGGTIERTTTLTRGALLGGVVVGPEGAAVPDATVRIWGESWSGEASTDSSGAWRVDAVAAGTYRLLASSATHAPVPELIVEFDGGAPRADVAVSVTRGAKLTGRVIDASGDAVAHPFIVMIDTKEEHLQGRTVRGDDSGRLELSGIEPSTYKVFAHERHRASAETEVVLAEGETSQIEFVLEHAAISGVVVDANGNPIAGAEVRACGHLLRGDVTDRQGRFDLGAFPLGQHAIQARWPVQHERARGANASVAAGDTAVRLVLPASTTIVGRVLFDGAPMQHFGVLLTTCPQFPWIGRPLGVHDADGCFVLDGVTAGNWGIVVAGPGTAMHTISRVTVEEGGAVDVGEIHLTRGQRIAGYVRDPAGIAVAGARVTIGRRDGNDDGDPLQQWFSCDFETVTDAHGAFAFNGITSVRAPNARPTPIAASHPDLGVSVALPVPAGDAIVDLTLVETGTIEGVVEGFSGRFAMINAHRRGEPADLRGAKLSASGRFVIDRVPPGDYSIAMMSTPGQPTAAPVKVSVAASQRTSVRLIADQSETPSCPSSTD